MSEKQQSDILITQPIPVVVFSALACLMSIFILAFLMLGEYTQKQRLVGILVPDKGLIKVYSPMPSTVESLMVKEGDPVNVGQVLYILNRTNVSESQEVSRMEIRERLQTERRSLRAEEERQITINSEESLRIQSEIRSLEYELSELDSSLILFDEQIVIAKDTLARYEKLADKGMYSKILTQEKEIEILSRLSQRKDLERQKSSSLRQINAVRREAKTSSLRGQNEMALITRNIENIERELLSLSSGRKVEVVSPIKGIITGISKKPGQITGVSTPLVSILPEGSILQAEIYVPSNAIGFVNQDTEVLLRYRAFPYQKFGQHPGKIQHISRAAVPSNELDSSVNVSMKEVALVYRITVDLPSQSIMAYGEFEPLQAGMELDADILLDKRSLFEWMFEPLFSITG